MANATHVAQPATFCDYCEEWHPGVIVSTEYLDADYEQGTPLDEVCTYTQCSGPCGHDDSDGTAFRQVTSYWKCGLCDTVHGAGDDDDPQVFMDAVDCCT